MIIYKILLFFCISNILCAQTDSRLFISTNKIRIDVKFQAQKKLMLCETYWVDHDNDFPKLFFYLSAEGASSKTTIKNQSIFKKSKTKRYKIKKEEGIKLTYINALDSSIIDVVQTKEELIVSQINPDSFTYNIRIFQKKDSSCVCLSQENHSTTPIMIDSSFTLRNYKRLGSGNVNFLHDFQWIPRFMVIEAGEKIEKTLCDGREPIVNFSSHFIYYYPIKNMDEFKKMPADKLYDFWLANNKVAGSVQYLSDSIGSALFFWKLIMRGLFD